MGGRHIVDDNGGICAGIVYIAGTVVTGIDRAAVDIKSEAGELWVGRCQGRLER